MQASPSKARAQAIESHSWSIVHSWLSNIYNTLPVPSFEHNVMTLKALQSLMAENIAADRARELLFDAQCEEFDAEDDATRRRERGMEIGSSAESLLSSLEDSLSQSAKRSLDSLASSAAQFGYCPPDSSSPSTGVLESLQSQILNLPRQTFALEGHISSIGTLASTLRAQITQTERVLSAFCKDTTSASHPEYDIIASPPSTPPHSSTSIPPPDYSYLHAQTLQHQRETKQLQLKSAEYHSRIDTLERQLTATQSTSLDTQSTASLATKQQSLDRKRKQIEALEARFKEFHGLPPDIEASRKEVQRVQGKLDGLKRRRDRLFEAM